MLYLIAKLSLPKVSLHKKKFWLLWRVLREIANDVARDLKLSHAVVLRWSKDLRIPSRENMHLIFKYTGGVVQPNDFYVGD